jgi:hypothetical protein
VIAGDQRKTVIARALAPYPAEGIGRSLRLNEEDQSALQVAGLTHQLEQRSLPEFSPGEILFTAPDRADASGECALPGCAEPACASLLDDRYWLAHFITASYEQVYVCLHQFAERPATEESAEQLRTILTACMEQASSLIRESFPLSTLARAPVAGIRYTASELRRRLRRSPRVADSRPVRLVRETPGRL